MMAVVILPLSLRRHSFKDAYGPRKNARSQPMIVNIANQCEISNINHKPPFFIMIIIRKNETPMEPIVITDITLRTFLTIVSEVINSFFTTKLSGLTNHLQHKRP